LATGSSKIELALFDQHHRRDRDDRLGHRRQAEDRVLFHRDLLLAILVADRLDIGRLVVARDHQHRARQFAAIDISLIGLRNALQPRRRKAQLLGLGDRREILGEGDARPADCEHSRDRQLADNHAVPHVSADIVLVLVG
jgi:hypothetical protein